MLYKMCHQAPIHIKGWKRSGGLYFKHDYLLKIATSFNSQVDTLNGYRLSTYTVMYFDSVAFMCLDAAGLWLVLQNKSQTNRGYQEWIIFLLCIKEKNWCISNCNLWPFEFSKQRQVEVYAQNNMKYRRFMESKCGHLHNILSSIKRQVLS